jgi:soluble lytic murein transglycosylase-like protein
VADQQRDPEIRGAVSEVIGRACLPDGLASWAPRVEPQLRTLVPDRVERAAILRQIYCETHREDASRLPPGLVLALIAVSSRFDRHAASPMGAVGLMLVMPFWPEQLGVSRADLTAPAPNIQVGCAILRFYLEREQYNVARALARYAPGGRNEAERVLAEWSSRWAAADEPLAERLRTARAP